MFFQVNIVDPLKLTEEFGSILANPVIATNVTATLLLHKHLWVHGNHLPVVFIYKHLIHTLFTW